MINLYILQWLHCGEMKNCNWKYIFTITNNLKWSSNLRIIEKIMWWLFSWIYASVSVLSSLDSQRVFFEWCQFMKRWPELAKEKNLFKQEIVKKRKIMIIFFFLTLSLRLTYWLPTPQNTGWWDIGKTKNISQETELFNISKSVRKILLKF